MASANYVLLEKITVGAAGASSVTFSNIPQTGYTDLVVKMSARSDTPSTVAGLYLRFNGETTDTNNSNRYLEGNGSSAVSATNLANILAPGAGVTANGFSNYDLYIPNYTSSNQKTVSIDGVTENNAAGSAYLDLIAYKWTGTAAIASIALVSAGTEKFVQYSTFYLYGVAKLGTTPAIVPYATGGDTIMTDGTYWYHTFLSSGTFTPTKGLSCDVLVVAGGGGGGRANGGGGGAGGFRTLSSTSLSPSSYTVTIGAGGAGGTGSGSTPVAGTSGNNSSITGVLTSTAGGGGGTASVNGSNGGSGGGGGTYPTSSPGTGNVNSYSPVEGYTGGTANGPSNYNAGGGGGAGAVGGNAGTSGGTGGIGLSSAISGGATTGAGQLVSGTYYFGGGGGGGGNASNSGAGGSGGGGFYGANGTANTGGGGGGGGLSSGTYSNGGSGGSGIVIVRYAV